MTGVRSATAERRRKCAWCTNRDCETEHSGHVRDRTAARETQVIVVKGPCAYLWIGLVEVEDGRQKVGIIKGRVRLRNLARAILAEVGK